MRLSNFLTTSRNVRIAADQANYRIRIVYHFNLFVMLKLGIYLFKWNFGVSQLAFASLESLGQDKTFKSLESLVRLFPKVSKVIIFFFWMHKNG